MSAQPTTTDPAESGSNGSGFRKRAGTNKPIAAVLSQAVVAGSSLVLQLIALRQTGLAGLGAFSLLFAILITVNSVQSGWLGDSLTVLDRFDPGIRRALVRSQVVIIGITFVVTTGASLPVDGVDGTTAVLFGIASVAWVIEETLRRLLIARREFWKLVGNDLAFAAGSFGLLAFTGITGNTFALRTLVLSLLAGAAVAISVGVIQLPRNELSRGLLGPSRLREVASFAIWRAAQIGLRPGSQALIRVIVLTAASYEALGRLEAARLLLAPILTIVNGAGVYLLPTYSAQAKQRRALRPSVPLAMAAVGAAAGAYGLIALLLRTPLTELLTDQDQAVTALAVIAWAAFAAGFGAGVPAGNALVARGHSRDAFMVRIVDAAVGISVATLIAFVTDVDAVPIGLAVGTFVGAALLLRRLRTLPPIDEDVPAADTTVEQFEQPTTAPTPAIDEPLRWESITARQAETTETSAFDPPATAKRPVQPPHPVGTATITHAPAQVNSSRGRSTTRPMVGRDRWLWLIPLVMIVATEYKFRRREIDDALGGSIDIAIALELGIYALIGTWAVWRLAPTKPRLTALTVGMWGYILTTSVSALYSMFPMLGLARAVQLVIIGAVMHVIATDGRLDQLSKFLHGWIVLLTVSIFIGLAYVAPTTNAQQGRFTWLSVHSVSAGSMLALSVPILFGLWLSSRRPANPTPLPWPTGVYALLFAFHGVFLLLTRTRGSIGGALVALAVMAWILSGVKAKPQLVLGSLVGGGAALLAFGPTIITYLNRGESVESIGTFNRRTEIWTLAWDAFVSRPLHGLGFTSAKGVFFDETGLGGAHNALINVMIDAGLAGLTWWLGLIIGVGVAIARVGRWARQNVGPGAIGSARVDHATLVGIFTASLINSVTTEGLGAGVNVSAIWLFLMVGWICILRREAAPAATPPPAGAPSAAPQSQDGVHEVAASPHSVTGS